MQLKPDAGRESESMTGIVDIKNCNLYVSTPESC